MLKKILFFMPDGLYGTTRHFTHELRKAFQKKGVETKIFDFEEIDVLSVMEIVKMEKPDFTCTFNPILPLSDGRLFCDYVKTPHLNILVDISIDLLYLLKSPYSIISCVDLFFCEYLKMGDFRNTLFFPHGVNSDIVPGEEKGRIYDVVMLGTCNDYENISDSWEKTYSPKVARLAKRVIEEVFSDSRTSYLFALMKSLEEEKISPKEIHLTKLFREVEACIKGRGRVEMVRAIKDAEVHIFGESKGSKGWKDYLSSQKNVVFHDSIPFEETIEVMRKSKILLNSVPFFKYGSHERLFYGLASGASVVTDETLFNKGEFKQGEGVLFYKAWKSGEISSEIKELLKEPKKRIAAVEKGRQKVLEKHSWECRVDFLVKEMPGILDRIARKTKSSC